MDRTANAAFYGSSKITPEQIFESSGNAAPPVANQFVQVLTAQTRRLPTQPTINGEVASVSSTAEPESNVKTYGMPDPDEQEAADDGVPQR